MINVSCKVMEMQMKTKRETKKATESERKPDISALSCSSAVSSDLLQKMKICLEIIPAVWDSFAYCTLCMSWSIKLLC